jgi:hypothetical protein
MRHGFPLLAAALALLAAAGCGRGPTYKGEPVNLFVRKTQLLADPILQRRAMGDLLKEGAGASPAWKALLQGEDAELAAMALAALGSGGPGAFPVDLREPVLACLSHGSAPVRAAAVDAVGLLWGEDATLAKGIVAAAGDPEREVRRSAYRALRALGPATGGIELGALEKAEKDPSLKHEAVLALAFCGRTSPEIEKYLLEIACDPKDPGRAREASWALASLGAHGTGVAGSLVRALPGAPEGVAIALADALGLLGGTGPEAADVAKALEKSLSRSQPAVSVAIALALVHLGRRDAALEKILFGGLRGDAATRVRAAEGLAHLGRDEALQIASLTAQLSAPSGGARTEAAAALGLLAAAGKRLPEEALRALEAGRRDANPDVRRVSLRALAAAGGK